MKSDTSLKRIANATSDDPLHWEPVEPPGEEITAATLRAGVEAFVMHDARYEGIEEAVIRIYRRMISVQKE